MPTVPLRKRLAGSDSYGNVWPEDGAVVDVDYDQAMDLMRIADAGFTVADAPEDASAQDVSEPAAAEPLDEVAPDPDQPATDAPAKKPTARRGTKA